MGYDDGECIGCYCNFGGNCDGTERDMCLVCIYKLCGTRSSNRVTYVLKNNDWDTNETCDACLNDGITIRVTVCDYHVGECNRSDEADENTNEESES